MIAQRPVSLTVLMTIVVTVVLRLDLRGWINGSLAPDLVRIRVNPYIGYGPFYLAQADQLFERENIRAEHIDITSTPSAVPALARGDLDVLPVSMTPGVFNAIARGGRMRIVAGHTQFGSRDCTVIALVGRRDAIASGKFQTASSMRGRRLSTESNLLSIYLVDRMLKSLGLTTADVQLREAPETASIEALRNESLDLAIVGEPRLTPALADGTLAIWKSANEVIDGAQYGVIVYGPRLLDHPDLGVRVMTTYLRGVRQFNLGKTQHNVETISRALGLDRDALTRMCWTPIRSDGAIDTNSVLDFQKWAISKQLIDRPLAVSEMIDTRFLEAARKAITR